MGNGGGTPFRRYKLWPYSGGIRTPLVMSWKGYIESDGIRSPPVDVINIAPTIVQAIGVDFRRKIDGVEQIPVAGRSIMPIWTSAFAPTRPVQFFSLRGNRAIRRWPAVVMHKFGTDFANDRWELFNLDEDFAEAIDLSKIRPAKLEELKKLWWSEASKFSSPPMVEPDPHFTK